MGFAMLVVCSTSDLKLLAVSGNTELQEPITRTFVTAFLLSRSFIWPGYDESRLSLATRIQEPSAQLLHLAHSVDTV